MAAHTLILGDCLEKMAGLATNSVDTIITDPPYGISFMGRNWDQGVPGVLYWKEVLRVAKPGAMLMAFGGTRTVHRLACAIEDAGWVIRDRIVWIYGSGFPKSLDISKAIDKAAGVEREVVGFSKQQQQRTPAIGTASYGDYKGQNGDITRPASSEAQEWDGWGTALKPAIEPILLCQKPFTDVPLITENENVLSTKYEQIVLAMKPLDGTFAENAKKWGVAGL